jgi:hypothetical protein
MGAAVMVADVVAIEPVSVSPFPANSENNSERRLDARWVPRSREFRPEFPMGSAEIR